MNENAILNDLEYDASAGRLSYKGVRYLLVRPETLVAFQLAVEAEVGPEKCAELMQAGGFTGGVLSARRYREVFGYADREIAEFMCRMGQEIGWGRFTLVKLDTVKREMVVEVAQSPFAEAYRTLPSPPPVPASPVPGFPVPGFSPVGRGAGGEGLAGGEGVCHFTRGVLGGLGAGIFGGEVVSNETACLARGHAVCRFEVCGR